MNKISLFNEWLAKRATLVFGTMWMFYGFFIYGLLPLVKPLAQFQSQIFYWSGWVQLWALPLLMVGQIVLGRDSEKRAQQDHETLMAEFDSQKEELKLLREENAELRSLHKELHSFIKGEKYISDDSLLDE